MVELKHSAYFEGILQLRNPTKELIDFVKRKTERDDKAVITKEKKVRNGVDLYFSSQRYLRALGKHLTEVFTGEMKTSRSLHTVSKETGKLLYRVTVLFRLLSFKRGDKFEMLGEEYEITNIEKRVTIKNLKSGKKQTKNIDEIMKYF